MRKRKLAHQSYPEMRAWADLGPSPHACQFPFNNPGDPDFHFCGYKTVEGKPYCAEHMTVCYRPSPPPRPSGHENIGDVLHLPRRVA